MVSRLVSAKLVLAVSLVSLPAIAQAGVFSFVSNLFTDNQAETDLPVYNSQNLALLQASVSPNPNFSSGGGEVVIVDGVALASESSPSNSSDGEIQRPASDQISMYVVRSGDTLGAIARMFGVSENTVMWTNDLKSKTVKEGQVLVILPISGVRHTVKKGDTIASIAKKYKGDAEDIRSYNDLDKDDVLAVGAVVIIPDGEIVSEPKAAPKKSSSTSFFASAGSNTTVTSGYFMRPIKGGTRTQGIHGYNAVDLASPSGSTIYAAAAGEVIISRQGGWNGGYGNYIVIAHGNGTQTLYSHNSSNIVSVGQKVVQGQVIGYVGNTGKSTGPHVHFEVRGAKNPF